MGAGGLIQARWFPGSFRWFPLVLAFFDTV